MRQAYDRLVDRGATAWLEEIRTNLTTKGADAHGLLRKLLNDELKLRRAKNLVQSEAFSEKLEKTVARYRNRAVETMQVIEELLDLAKDLRAAQKRGDDLGLTEDELALYDALEANDSAVAVLTKIAHELTETIRKSVTIDWTVKDAVRAKLRTLVRRKLRQCGYRRTRRRRRSRRSSGRPSCSRRTGQRSSGGRQARGRERAPSRPQSYRDAPRINVHRTSTVPGFAKSRVHGRHLWSIGRGHAVTHRHPKINRRNAPSRDLRGSGLLIRWLTVQVCLGPLAIPRR
jgi:hypothetical protein